MYTGGRKCVQNFSSKISKEETARRTSCTRRIRFNQNL